MLGLLGLVSTIFTAKQLISEALEKPAPKGTRVDYDAISKDILDGMSSEELMKKRKRGDYDTTEPEVRWQDLPLKTIVDEERYRYDLETYGEYITQLRVNQGKYRWVDPPASYKKVRK